MKKRRNLRKTEEIEEKTLYLLCPKAGGVQIQRQANNIKESMAFQLEEESTVRLYYSKRRSSPSLQLYQKLNVNVLKDILLFSTE